MVIFLINYYLRRIKDKKLKKIQQYRKGCWISVINPTEEELLDITKKYALDLDLLKDGLDNNELPRIEKYENKIYIYIKTLSKDNELITTLFVISNEFILSLSNGDTKLNVELFRKDNITYTTQINKTLIY